MHDCHTNPGYSGMVGALKTPLFKKRTLVHNPKHVSNITRRIQDEDKVSGLRRLNLLSALCLWILHEALSAYRRVRIKLA